MNRPLRVLIVDDAAGGAEAMLGALRAAGFAPVSERVESADALRATLKRGEWEIVLCGYGIAGLNAVAALDILRECQSALPVLVVSGTIGEEKAAELMRAGAADVLRRENVSSRLALAAERELAAAEARRRATQSEQRFRDIADVAGDWIWETDAEHRFTFFAGQTLGTLEIQPASVLGKTRWELAGVDPRRDGHWARHKAELDAHQPFRGFRYALTTPSGAPLHLSVNGKPIFDEAGRFSGYRGAATDESAIVEARRRAEEAGALLRDAVDSIAAGFVIYDNEDRLVICNENYRRLYPESAHRMVPGVRFEDILRGGLERGQYADAKGREEEWLAERMRQHRQVVGPVEQRLSNGRWALVTERRMRNGWIAGLRIDITELKVAQQALSESEEVARGIIDTALDAFFQMDEAGTVLEWNRQAQATFGWSRQEAMGRALADLVLPRGERERQAEGFARFLAGAAPGAPLPGRRLELDAQRRDGSALKVEVTVTALRRRGGYVFNGFIRDLTERIAAEAQLRQAQKMEAIGNLTGGLAHDFNNLLGIIIGNLDLLGDDSLDRALQKELRKDALESALRGSDLTRRLLAFARRQPLRPRVVDVNALVSEITALLKRTLGENIEFHMNLADELWPIRADAAQLEAAMLNLATNARDAMPRGGKLIIRTANTPLDDAYVAQHAELAAGDYVLIEVCDTGIGMSAEIAARIFEPFFTTKEAGKGTGLGLSMVFGFIKQSGGHINVYSEESKGTCFRLYLPRTGAAESDVTTPVAAVAPAGGGRETVLVVEDNEGMRRVVVRQLVELGYRVVEADHAAAALSALRHSKVDLLFTDVVMPGGIDGSELAREACALVPGLKVLFTSGFPEARTSSGGWLSPDVPLLSKPYRKDELARAVRQVLDSRAAPGAESST
jgi:PAS domain S-box-containing protein